mmetsp:Transcript_113594/g.275898  ORF Transcript_113594/g.275898 Transcript_113594/m.275898 type:complete len:357 (+) Transcript_113594:71-1141(+)
MAPAKSKKRGAKAPTPLAKKPKIDRNMVGVLDAFKQAEGLPLSCRAMLEAGLPGCVATPANERHKLQTTVVSWIEKVFNGIQARLQDAVEGSNSQVAASTAKRDDLEAKIAEAKSVVDGKAEGVNGKQTDLAAAREAVQDAEAKLEAALAAQKAGDSELTKASDAKEKLEAALAEDLSFLKTEEGFEPAEAKAHMKKLTPIAKQLQLDESLLTALPSACTQAPSKRGIFDCVVIEQLDSHIQSKIRELDRLLKSGESSAAERAAAVAAAQSQVEAASAAESTATSAVSAAQAEEKEATDELNVALAALDATADEHTAALAAQEEKAVSLDNFKNYNLECFRIFCNTDVQEEPPAES